MGGLRPAVTLTDLYSTGKRGDLGTTTSQGEIFLQPGQLIEPKVTPRPRESLEVIVARTSVRANGSIYNIGNERGRKRDLAPTIHL